MPILKYFLTVGSALTLGLIVLAAYLEPVTPAKIANFAKITSAPTAASIVKLELPRARAR